MSQIKKYSAKRQKIEVAYKKVIKEIKAETEPYCQGCGKGGIPLSFSHRIPRSRRVDLIAEKENIDLMCYGHSEACHEKVEAGRYDELINGEEIKAYIKENDFQYFQLKTGLHNKEKFLVIEGKQTYFTDILNLKLLQKITKGELIVFEVEKNIIHSSKGEHKPRFKK